MARIEGLDIFFIRHGETEWNAEGRYQGRRDIPLNARGKAQADANGPLLFDLLGRDHYDPARLAWYMSPLDRTRETMRRVRAAFAGNLPPPLADDRLIEISFGALEGSLSTDVSSGIVGTGDRDASFWDFRPEDGENYEDLSDRVQSLMGQMISPCVVVAHGGVARVFRYLLTDVSKEVVVNWHPPQNAVMHFTSNRMALYESAVSA